MIQIVSEKYQLQGVGNSLQGGRSENQDDIGFQETPLGFFLVVCDGMGGGPGGKTASYIAKYEMINAICSCNSNTSRMTAMKMAVSRANDALYRKMDEVPALRGMGSTMVAILVNKESAIIAHLGDSRCYRLKDGKVLFRTMDHSLVGELVCHKAMTEEQARVSPQSNVITRALGNTDNHVPVISEVAYKKGDRFILCTDGVWGVMPHDDLIQRFSAIRDVTAVVTNLSLEIDRIGFAHGGHHDNHTMAIIEMNTDSILKDKMSKQTKIILAVLSGLLVVSLIFNITCLLSIRASSVKVSGLIKEIEKLKPYETLYSELSDKGDKESYTKIYVLTIQNDSLQRQLTSLELRLDSLEGGRQSDMNFLVKGKSIDGNNVQTIKKTNDTPVEILRNIIINLDLMKNAKEKSLDKVSKKKSECRNEILYLLNLLNTKTDSKYKPTIEIIRTRLTGDVTALKIDQKDSNGYFKSTKVAEIEINSIKDKVKEIEVEFKK